jgi:hypothetical protein
MKGIETVMLFIHGSNHLCLSMYEKNNIMKGEAIDKYKDILN